MKPRELKQLLKRRRQVKEDPTARAVLWKRGQGRCWYCGTGVSHGSFIVNHHELIPKAGKRRNRTRVISCAVCDQLKGPMSIEEFRTSIQARLETKKPVVFFGEWNYFLRKQKPPLDGLVIESGLPVLVRNRPSCLTYDRIR